VAQQGDAPYIGERVLLANLVSRADLNGRYAMVLSFDPQYGRYTVEVDSSGEQVAIKPTNMQPVQQHTASAPPLPPVLEQPAATMTSPPRLERRLSQLPPEWRLEEDPSTGEQYYYNAATGESTWERPKVAFHGAV